MSESQTKISRIPAAVLVMRFLLHPSCGPNEKIATKEIPEEIKLFQETRDLCDHYRGEPPDDPVRQTVMRQQMKTYCTGTDGKLRSLRLKYQSNQTVISALTKHQDRIE